MLCILCVQTSADYIHIFQDEGSALNIKEIIIKHFWLQPNESDVNSNVICASCWRTLESFHNFYMRVEDAHVRLQSTSAIDEDDLKLEREIAEAFRVANAEHFDGILPQPEVLEADVKVEVKEDNDATVPPDAVPLGSEKHVESQIGSSSERRNSTDSANTVENETPPACSTRSRTSLEKPYVESDSSSDNKIENDDATEMQTASSDWLDVDSDIEDDEDDSDYDVTSTTTSKSKSKKQKAPRKTTTKRNCKKDDDDDPNNEPKKKKRTSEQVTKKMARMKEYDDIIAKSMKLSCDICLEAFANFAIMKRHFRSVHKECGYIACCGKKFRKRGVLVDHICTHQNPDYFKCEKCGRILANRKGLDCHMLTHDTEKQRIYQCDQCPMSFYTKPLLSRHLQTHLSERNIKCPECDKRFSTQDILRTHINNVHNAAYTRICDQCGKSFRRPDAFRRHQLEHDGVTRPLVPCEKCSVKLTSKYGLKRHMQSMHPETDMKHVCDDCGKIAPSAAALQRHISYMHKMERKYKCPMCDKAFKKTGGLKPIPNDGNANVICPSCWSMLSSFHKFYLKVEEAYEMLEETSVMEALELKLAKEMEQDNEIIPATEIKLEAEEVFEQTIPSVKAFESQGDTKPTLIPETAPSTSFIRSQTSSEENSCIVKMEKDSGNLSPDSQNQNSDNEYDEEEEDSDDSDSDNSSSKPRSTKKNADNKNTKKQTPRSIKMNENDELIAKTVKLSCDICALIFPRFTVLKKHYRSAHKQNGYATCCGIRLFKRCILVDHINRHKNPEYFKCDECGRVLSTRKNLKRHMLIHNLDQRTRNYHCDKCYLSFYTNNLLSRHMHTHISGNNIKCPHCDKFFSTEFLVRRHIHGAHNTKFKTCDQCGISFRTVNALRQHQLEHNEIFQNHKEDIRKNCESIKQENVHL